MIKYCRAYLTSMPFIPSLFRIKPMQITGINLTSRINVNQFEGFNWSVFDLMFDSGNANGDHIKDILSISEPLNICIYDNPKSIKSTKILWANQKVNNSTANNIMIRISFEEGEILKSLPTASSNENLYCFVNVFSGLNDRDCLTVLTNAKKAIGQFTATVAIIDAIRPEPVQSQIEVIDGVQFLFGRKTEQRTLAQWKYLIDESDFTMKEIVELSSSNKVLLLKPI